MATQSVRIALLLALASVALAVKTLNYNVGGPPIGKFCGDPGAFLISKASSFAYINKPKVGALGALASHRALSGGSNKFEFLFPVPAGKYKVVLGFAEVWPGAFVKGKRLFDYALQGTTNTKSFDVFNGAGADKALWRTINNVNVVGKSGLKISFIQGAAQKPMVSVIEITRADGKNLDYPTGTVCKGGSTEPVGGTGPGKDVTTKPPPNPNSTPLKCGGGVRKVSDNTNTGGTDHQAHSVAGEGYVKTDFDGDGKVSVLLDGSKSHSHYFDPKTKVSGKIVAYQWTANGKVIGTTEKLQTTFPVGKTVVTLTVRDNLNDVACENTEVIGLPASNNGAYCYFYPGLTKVNPKLNLDPKPQQGVKVENINWPTTGAFPFIGKSGKEWTVRCIANLKVGAIAAGAIQLNRNGRVHVYVNGATLVSEGIGKGGNGVVKVGKKFAAGTVPLNIVYNKGAGAGKLVLQLNGVPVKQGQLMFSQSGIIPVLKEISPDRALSTGGNQMQLFGNGFFNNPLVFVGKAKVAVKVVSTSELLITVPSQAQAGSKTPIVYVGNKAGESNNFRLTYDPIDGSKKCNPSPVTWNWSFLKNKSGAKHSIALIASIAIGPDFNYYMGSQDGFVYKVSADRNLVVTSQCKSFSMGQARSVLGIAFNPWKKAAQPYITTSTLFRKSSKVNTPLKNKVDGWANGKVQTLTVGCKCFCGSKDIVTGLPVSHHDHSVNKIVFLPNGDMLLTVAGATNGGHNTPGNLLGGLDETVLSASILLIKTSKGDNIDGNVKYTQYANPGKALKIGAKDVQVYATGLRNSFGICRTVKGQIYATDNGANKGFGLKSTGCNSQTNFGNNILDELNHIKEGSHYGHANRAQGKCVWGQGTKPVATFQSSTDGLVQYQSNAFCGDLKFDIIGSQYTTQNAGFQGNTNRIILNPNGSVKSKFVMAAYSGVAVENGLYGELVMPRVGKFMVAVLQPKYKPLAGIPFVVACNPKMGRGDQKILVTGNNFKAGLKAFVGGKPCTKVAVLSPFSFTCITPPGKGLVSISVTNPDGKTSPKFVPAGDFSYL